MDSARPYRQPLIGLALFRENPGPPERPDWDGGRRGGPWSFGLLAAFLAIMFLARFVGPVVSILAWAAVFVGYLVLRRKNRRP
jgi:hypothetical protein